jgi:hypothetical protein
MMLLRTAKRLVLELSREEEPSLSSLRAAVESPDEGARTAAIEALAGCGKTPPLLSSDRDRRGL